MTENDRGQTDRLTGQTDRQSTSHDIGETNVRLTKRIGQHGL